MKISPLTMTMPDKQRSLTPLGLIPMVVATTGHRFFPAEDTPKLESAVKKVLSELQEKSPSSPRWLINGLAEGADRLVARVALSLGWEVHAVIPISLDAFEMTMETDEAREEFRSLLSLCSSVNIVQLSSDVPNQMYVDVANVLCAQGQWLIALWDGADAHGPGGTAWVITQFEEGLPTDDGALPDAGPVIHILTRRNSSDVMEVPVGVVDKRPPRPLGVHHPSGIAQWDGVVARIDNYNKLARLCIKNHSADLSKSRFKLGDAFVDDHGAANRDLNRIGWIYAVADSLAGQFQARRNLYFKWMLFWSMLAIVSAELYSGPVENASLALKIALGSAGLAILPVVLKYQRFLPFEWADDIYLDCRALAEACRVQYYWRLTGIYDAVADVYLSEQRDELEWIRQAVRSTDIATTQTVCDSYESIKIAHEEWILGQKNYFIGEEKQNSRADVYQKKSAVFDRVITVLLIIVLSLFVLALNMEVGNKLLLWVQMGWGVCIGGAAAIKLYQRTLAFSENARRYNLMGLQAEAAEIRLNLQLNGIKNLDVCRKILKSYGRAALQENSYWLMLLRDRPASPSIGV
jgi:hypothetical protein